jgi:hypothetical protein
MQRLLGPDGEIRPFYFAESHAASPPVDQEQAHSASVMR